MSVIGTAKARISTYVDDPLISAFGTKTFRDRQFAIVLLIWGALWFPLSLTKAKRGKTITWTSGVFESTPEGIRVGIKEEIRLDVLSSSKAMVKVNVLKIKELHSFVGKLVHIASIVFTLRPFLTDLHAAIYTVDSKAPPGCIWLKQILHVLWWIIALLDGKPITRHYLLAVHLGTGRDLEINLDASPWGLGGYLVEDGVITSWFQSKIEPEEAMILDITVGSSSAQQTVEALAALAALRVWHIRWCQAGVRLRVRSDSVAALIVVLKLKTKGRGSSIIAREMALDIAWSNFSPHIAEHVPGVANSVCDALSRKYQPSAKYDFPAELEGVKEVTLPVRNKAYFKSLVRPPGAH